MIYKTIIMLAVLAFSGCGISVDRLCEFNVENKTASNIYVWIDSSQAEECAGMVKPGEIVLIEMLPKGTYYLLAMYDRYDIRGWEITKYIDSDYTWTLIEYTPAQ